MRLHTPVPFIERQTTKDSEIDGYFLPSGTVVAIQLYVLHHNAHVWEDPMVKYDRQTVFILVRYVKMKHSSYE